MEESYFLVPVTAALANASLFLENIGRRNPLNRILLVVYVLLFGTNVCAALMIASTSSDAAGWALFVMRHFLFPLPAMLLALAAFLSGRRVLNFFVIVGALWGILFLLAADATFLMDSHVFVLGLVKRSWGYFPHLAQPALVLLGGLNAFCMGASILLLARPDTSPATPLPFLDRRLLIAFVCLWWGGFFLNGPALSGSSFYPLGNGVDALVSILFSSYVHRMRPVYFSAGRGSSEGILRTSTEMLTAVAFGLLFWFATSSLLGPNRPAQLVLTVIMTAASIGFLQFLKTPGNTSMRRGTGKGTPLNLDAFGLSRQETRICELIVEGYGRSSMLVFLNISDGTLRNHLRNIYAKTIEPEGKVDAARRDHFQRLTVFLSRT